MRFILELETLADGEKSQSEWALWILKCVCSYLKPEGVIQASCLPAEPEGTVQ